MSRGDGPAPPSRRELSLSRRAWTHSPAFQSASGRECPEPGTGGAGVGAGGSRATDADTPVCDFTGAGAGPSGGRGARRGERLGAHLVGGAMGSARPGGGDGPLWCLGDGTERDRSGPRGSGPCGRCHSRERGRHRSPLTGIAAGVGGHAVNLGPPNPQDGRDVPLASLGPACAWRSGPSLSSPVLSSRTAGQGRDPEAKPPRPALCRPPSRRGPFCLYLAQGSHWAPSSSPLGPSASRSAGRGWAWKLLLSRDIWEDSTMFHRLVSSLPDQRRSIGHVGTSQVRSRD